MKGGYQILNLSTVTVGTKTKTKGSFEQAKGNNGKPVMVLTPDNQRVFAEVVESSGDYILAYLGGDGSTYTVLVEDDDNVTITKQESDATIATKVAELETAVGDVTDLDTTSKEVVGAINEVNSNIKYTRIATNVEVGTSVDFPTDATEVLFIGEYGVINIPIVATTDVNRTLYGGYSDGTHSVRVQCTVAVTTHKLQMDNLTYDGASQSSATYSAYYK